MGDAGKIFITRYLYFKQRKMIFLLILFELFFLFLLIVAVFLRRVQKALTENKQKLASQETEIVNLKNTLKRVRTKNSTLSSKVTYLEKQLKHARRDKSLEVINEGVPIKEDEKTDKDVHDEKEGPVESQVRIIGTGEDNKREAQKVHEI